MSPSATHPTAIPFAEADAVRASGRRTAMHAEFRRGAVACLPVLLGIVPFAMVLGARAAGKGLSLVEVPFMGGINFAGGSEFAAIELWSSPPNLLVIAAVTFLVNSRHLVMGATFVPLLAHLEARRVLPLLAVMCDESWALGLADARDRSGAGGAAALNVPYYLGTALPFWAAWILFTTLGAFVGPMLGDPSRLGFAMAFPAVFLVLLRGMWRSARAASPWLVSLIAAAATHLVVPGAAYVIVGACAGIAFAWFQGDAS